MIGITPHPKRIHTLGPEGTYSDKAAKQLVHALMRSAASGGTSVPSPEICYTRTLPEVLTHTERDPEALGVLPIENSDTGTVVPAQDALGRHQVRIVLEMSLAIRFCLLANAPLSAVTRLFAQPVALGQCDRYVATNLPIAETVLTHSNTESGLLYLKAREEGPVAAIVPPEFSRDQMPEAEARAELVAEDLQNYEDNFTRFVVVTPTAQAGKPDFTRHKASLLVDPGEDRPGLLYEILSVFKQHKVNLTRLESRPARTRAWTYVFYLDIDNNPETPKVLEALSSAGMGITVLGSYDRLG